MSAPLIGGWIWSGSLLVDYPGHQWAVYFLALMCNLVAMVVGYTLPDDLERSISGSDDPAGVGALHVGIGDGADSDEEGHGETGGGAP